MNEDILLKHWELYCELEKNLALQASIYTKEPYYKEDRQSEDFKTFLEYACKDSAITIECDEKITRSAFNVSDQLKPAERNRREERYRHYKFNETLLNALLYMETRGIAFNQVEAIKRKKLLEEKVADLQFQLDSLTGFGLKITDKVQLRLLLRDTMCYKRDSSKIKVGYEEAFNRHYAILSTDEPLTPNQLGSLSIDLDLSLNIEGGKFKPYLYETLLLPEQRDPKTKNLTADYEALQTLLNRLKSDHKSCSKSDKQKALLVLPLAIELGEMRTRLEHVSSMSACISDFSDGRVHSFYNEVGSETGRVTCGKLFKRYGYPLQTVEDENELKPEGHPLRQGLRDLLTADEGCYLAKCDLKGADGWTIGANLAALGDTTMLEDLKFGLKPAHFPCYERRHGKGSTSGKTRLQLQEMFKEIKKSDWDYFAAKQCTWGFFYLLGLTKAAQHVANVSEGTVWMSEVDMANFKDALMRRYNGLLWWRATERRLFDQPYPPILQSPSGHSRMFFGRRQEILGQALAHEPQSITTYATNMAVYNCWLDPENRRPKQFIDLSNGFAPLRVEPLHQVHDEFVCQFRKEDTEFVKKKIKEWFNNPIKIAGVEVVIPYDGQIGTNWGMVGESKIDTL